MVCLVCSCSVKEIRSPVVFRNPVVFGEPETEKSTAAGALSNTSMEMVSGKHPTRSLLPLSPVLAPSDIRVFSEEELKNHHFAILGDIQVSSVSLPGFTRQQAINELKVDAFKRYGGLARAITHIQFGKRVDSLSTPDHYREVSGVVVMLAQASGDEGSARPEKLVPGSKAVADQTGLTGTKPIFPVDKIQLFSSDDLLHLNFKIMGKVQVRRPRKDNGYTQKEIIEALKVEAFRKYGSLARGLTHIRLIKMPSIFYYTKVRKNISTPKEPDTFEKGSAEVVTWN